MPLIHNGPFIAMLAHGLIGISLVWDKVLLKKPETKNLLTYVFWLGAISIFGLLLAPFGFRFPGVTVAAIATLAGVLDMVASYFYYAALKAGAASQTLAIMGGFSPIATAILAIPLLRHPLERGNYLAFFLMVAGGFSMFFAEKVSLRDVLPNVFLASINFGMTNVLQKWAFERTNFVSGFVFITIGTFVASMFLLVRSSWRDQIFEASEKAEPRSRFWYFVNRFMAGLGSFLVFYAVSLTSPAIVSAITGLRYVIVFLGAYGLTLLRPEWLSEKFGGRSLLMKSAGTALIVAGLVLLGLRSGDTAEVAAAHSRKRIITAVAPLRRRPGQRPSSAASSRLLLECTSPADSRAES